MSSSFDALFLQARILEDDEEFVDGLANLVSSRPGTHPNRLR